MLWGDHKYETPDETSDAETRRNNYKGAQFTKGTQSQSGNILKFNKTRVSDVKNKKIQLFWTDSNGTEKHNGKEKVKEESSGILSLRNSSSAI